ncbi:MAG: ribose 5-phosphate isomerase B [Prevotellaceae bacterium]|jgi:ribose 5-phosphate isomerase B|nr:ribose 5-phosphate isomerase B [Prevotellaceae bacterium]
MTNENKFNQPQTPKSPSRRDLGGLRIAICSDHAGYELKEKIIACLKQKQVLGIQDFGAFSSESSDYPDYAHPMASAVEKGDFDFGISVCGSGNGINMTANKHQGIRAALCWRPEIAALAREHNNANVLSLPARFVSDREAFIILDVFFSTEFEGGRHERRVGKI